ncbi:MAG: MMPL family transporter [Pirellulales bacterium]
MPSFDKLSRITLTLLILLLPAAIYAVLNLPVGSAGVHEWLPKGRQERQRYEQFLQQFGSDQVLIVSWDRSSLEDSRVMNFVELATQNIGEDSLLTAVVSPIEIFDSLEKTRLSLSHQEAVRRLQGAFIGKSGNVPIVLAISEKGVARHKQTIELVQKLSDQVPELGRERLRMVGAVHESYAIDKAAEENLSQLVLPSSILALVISWICVGSFRAVCVVMLLAGCGQLVAVAVVFYGGYQFSAVLIVLPTLIFMLTLSGAIHLVNYLLEARRIDPTATGIQALKSGWWPCTLSSATTMLGMASLITSDLAPVRQFGVLSAICLGIATVLLLLAFPATADLLFKFQLGRSKQQRKASATIKSTSDVDFNVQATTAPVQEISEPAKPGFLAIPPSFELRYLPWLRRNANSISLISLVLLVLAFLGVAKLKSSTKFADMFPADHKTHRDMVWYEENIGPLATFEVLLTFPTDDNTDVLDEVKLIYNMTERLKQNEIVGACLSAATFLPKLSDASGIRATSIRAAQRRNIEEHLSSIQEQGLLFQTSTSRTWRVSARASAVSTLGFDQMIESISGTARACIEKHPTEVKLDFTGLTPVMHETQHAILSDLGYSFLSAYLLITPAMMLVVRSFLGGLLIMIPNVLPIALAFGAMGWFGSSLDIAGILTASVALGIAVDDTLHFTCWYMSERREGHSREDGIKRAFHACASAMMHTTLISCCSMLPFLFADFVPTHQFARLMVCILIAALAGDLVLLPALLQSPAGRVIRTAGRKDEV